MFAIHNVGETRYSCTGINAAELKTRFTILCSSCRENHNVVISFVILLRTVHNSCEVRAARAARLSFLTQPIKFLICGVVVVETDIPLILASFPYWARALGLAGENFRSARVQNLKLVLVVLLVLQSERRYWRPDNDVKRLNLIEVI